MAKSEFPKGDQWSITFLLSLSHTPWTRWYCRTAWGNLRGRMAASQPSPPSDFPSYQYFNLLMCSWTDRKCSLLWLKPSGKPSAPLSLRCSTYVAIDQAPVSARHICAQTSVALIWPTVTDDHASRGWCRWWMKESTLCVTFSPFQSLDERCGELLLNHDISTACPVVENTLLWLNKPKSITHISHSRFISYSFFLHSSLS